MTEQSRAIAKHDGNPRRQNNNTTGDMAVISDRNRDVDGNRAKIWWRRTNFRQ
ncbi:hypothetical protein A2U01_0050205 [Trifolium medium]|uniref:Uncharacterized protein n=1 Tax=Trifolium medium TaxID=97028 RepID=A0A392QXC4_9FABA|nr:hypothetical protein [Trifolium medium]